MWLKKFFNEGNQIHNFISSSGSGTVINYGSGSGSDFLPRYGSGYGSGSTSQKVTVPTVPVPQHWWVALLRIHDILGWIRIWIRGSMPLTNGSGCGCWSGSCHFRHWPSEGANKKTKKKKIFAYYFLKVLVHHFEDKKSKRSHKAVWISFFSFFSLGDRRIRIRIHTFDMDPDPDPWGPETCGSGFGSGSATLGGS